MWQRATQFQDRLVSLVQIPELPATESTPAVRATTQLVAAAPTLRVPSATAVRTATVVAMIAVTPTVALTPTVSATPTEPPATATLEPTATASPTAPPPTATATPDTNKYYTVRQGDSLMVIGERTGIEWRQIAQLNGINSGTMLHPGDKLLLPSAQAPSAAAAEAPSAPAKATTYTVKSGDSFAGIAAQFGLTWEEVARANGMNQRTMLQPGQQLVIPVPGAPPPTNTPAPTRSPTARAARAPATATVARASAAAAFPGPVPVNPSDGTPFQGADKFIELTWQPLSGLPPGTVYRVTIRYASGGVPQERRWDVTAPGMRVPAALWGLADQPARAYSWNVTAVQLATDGAGGERVIPISQPSASRSFSWN